MPNGVARDGYAPVAEAFHAGLDFGIYVALGVCLVLMVASTVRRLVGAV